MSQSRRAGCLPISLKILRSWLFARQVTGELVASDYSPADERKISRPAARFEPRFPVPKLRALSTEPKRQAAMEENKAYKTHPT